MLKFTPRWRAKPPEDGRFFTCAIPDRAIDAFQDLISTVLTQGNRWAMIEHFKGYFARASGSAHVRSSTESWAETDLWSYSRSAAENAPRFLEAVYDACEELRKELREESAEGFFVPELSDINAICEKHDIGYFIEPPNLVLRDNLNVAVVVTERPQSLADSALDLMEQSLQRAEELLRENRGREAVQELLWLLESVATAFRGLATESGTIQGKYFNQIARELRAGHAGAARERIFEWISSIHGFLSSPTGGGIRHGLDLNQGVRLSLTEAKLFCNLIRSFISYLMAEHERLAGAGGKPANSAAAADQKAPLPGR
jgi:hypothetical protein